MMLILPSRSLALASFLTVLSIHTAAPVDAQSLSFFVTSTGSGADGGNLGGLAGADAKCQTLAAAVGAGDREWRAYLRTGGRR